MNDTRKEIEILTNQQTKIKKENEMELERRKEAYYSLHNEVYSQVSSIESKKKVLYKNLMENIIKNHKIDFCNIAKLKVDEVSYDGIEEYTEYHTYENIPLIDYKLKIEEYTQFETSNTPCNFKWEDLVNTLCELSYWNTDRITIEEHGGWGDFIIKDKETNEEYYLGWGEDYTQALIEIETNNDEGGCTLKLYFDLEY